MRFSVFFLAALALIACASAALELRCSSGTLQGVGGALFGIYTTKSGVQRPIDCAAACAASKDCKSYQYCGFGSFNGTCAFAPEKKDGKDVTPTPAFANKGDCLLANGTSWRQAPSKPEYGGWTFGIGCRAAEVADAPVEKQEEGIGGGEEQPEKKAPAAAAVAPAARPTAATTPAAAEEPISPLRKPPSAKAAAPAAVEAGAADPNAPEVVAVAPKPKPAVPAAAAAAPPAEAASKAPAAPAAAVATTEPKAKPAAAPAGPAAKAAAVPSGPAAKAPATAAAKPASKAAAAPAAAPAAAVDPAAPVGPVGPGSLSAPIKGYLSGRASVAELQPGVESAAECASICAAAEKNAASSCAGYSWCGAPAGCPGNVATGVCQLWSGKAGSGKLAPNDSGWVSATREVEKTAQPPMKTQTAVGE